MSESLIVSGTTKAEKYESLLPQIKALVEGEPDIIANLSNIMSALKFGMDFFWVGVYFVRTLPLAGATASNEQEDLKELVLGPFQGPVACTRIAFGKGVCGKSWETKKTIIVEDVEKFPGHIACSSLSRSEIVLPVFNAAGNVALVMDVDSEHLSHFDQTDQMYLSKVTAIIEQLIHSQNKI
ncbi:MAG: GAF domain-containing protein [Bacteroidota bacterium]|nr:GAF domain-containing protein [Bacteroidota bacterium]